MKKNFTQLISGSGKSRQFSIAIATLMLLILSAVYLRAAIQTIVVTGGATFPVSADLAANSTSPGYTIFGDIIITEDADGDFAAGSGTLIITAPTGWRFKTSGVTALVENGNTTTGNSGTNVSIDNTTINHTATVITIPFTADKINQRDKVTIKGLEVQAINGGNLPGIGQITIDDGAGAQVSGLPRSLSKTLSQQNGLARQLTFVSQPGNGITNTVLVQQPVVRVLDQFGNTVSNGTGSTAPITLSIANNPAGSNGSLAGTPTINATSGVATFANLSINNAGQGYTLAAASGSLTSATSSPFNITNKKPTIASLSKTCSSVGDAGFNLTITGDEFVQGAKVRVTKAGGTSVDLDPTTLSKTQIVVAVDNTVFATAGTYSVRVVNKAAGQTDVISDPVTFTVYDNLAIDAITGTAQLCAGTSATYTAPTGFSNYNWSIPAGAGTITAGQGTRTATIAFAASASGNVTLSLNAANACGKGSSANFTVDVKAKPVVTIGATEPEICIGGSTTLTASGADSYVWSGNGVAGGTTGASLTVSPTANTTYTVIGTTNGCQSDAKTITIVVNPLPTVSIGTLNTEYCSSDAAVTLTGSPAGGSFRILKNSAEVATGTSFNPSVLGAGNYTIEYTYTDSKSCTNTTTKAVTVKQQPTVTVTNNLEICIGASTTLTAGGADSYTWSPATGLSAATGASVTANPTQTTTYTVVGTTNGCQSEAKTVTVTVNPLPDASITLRGPSVFCPENYVDLVAVSKPDHTYQWYRLNSNGSSTAVTASTEGPHVYSATTTGNYYVRITSDKGCVQTSEAFAVQVANVPSTANIGIVGSTTFCEGSSVRFNANQSPTSEPYSYQWQVSTTTTADNAFADIEGAEGSSYTATTSGYYRVLVSNTEESTPDVEKCTKTSVPVEVTVLPQPTAQILGGNQSLCSDPSGVTSFFLEGEYANGDYEWYVNKGGWTITDLGSSEQGKTKIRIDVAADNPAWAAMVTLRSRKTVSGCNLATSSVTLDFKQIPNTTISANRSTTLCKGESVILTANPGTGNYLWSTGATTRTITVTEAGNYTVTVTNSNDCAITSEPTSVIVNELPVVTIATQLNDAYCKSEEAVPLAGSPANGTFRILKGATVVVANATQLDPGALAAGTYTIEYSFTDGNTCTNTATKTVTINALPAVTIVEPSKAAYCTSEPAFSLAGNQSGGSFTINGQSATAFNAATLGAGTHTIVYTYTDSNGCTNTATKMVTVNEVPIVNIIEPAKNAYCKSEANVTLQGNHAGGTFRILGNNGNVVTNNATVFSPGTLAAGTYTIEYNFTDGNSCSNKVTKTVNLYNMPVVNGGTAQTKCQTIAASNTPAATLFTLAGTATVGGSSAGVSSQWAVVTKSSTISGVSFTDATSPASSVSVSGYGTVTLSLTASKDGCSVSSNVNLTVIQALAKPVVSGLATSYYTGDGNVTMSASPSGSNGKYIITKNNVEVYNSSNSTFAPCTLGPGTFNVTYTYSSGNCSRTSDPITVTIKQSTYTVVVEADPFPTCRGQITTYKAVVYRNVESVIYPYVADAQGKPIDKVTGALLGDQALPQPNYDYPFPQGEATPQILKDNAFRYFQPIVSGGVKMDSTLFNYQWTKNQQVFPGSDGTTFKNAGLSSLDYYAVLVTSKNQSNNCITPINTVISDRKYSSAPINYEVALNINKNPICKGESVTLTANLNAAFSFWGNINLKLYWMLDRGGVISQLGETIYQSGNTVQFTTPGPAGGFLTGDKVYVEFSSAVDTYSSNKCSRGFMTNIINMQVNEPVAIEPAQQSQQVCVGGTATFTAAGATGTPLNYQWYHGTTPVGTNAATLSLTNVQLSNAGDYFVKVWNDCTPAGVQVKIGTLVVDKPVVITTQPQAATVCEGSGASHVFSATASGDVSGYQWYKDGQLIAGATSATYTITNPTEADEASYHVVVTGTTACGNVSSSAAALTVNQPVTAEPAIVAATHCSGNALTMSVNASGTGLAYEWFKDNVSIGNNNNTLSIPFAETTHNGVYHVMVTGTCSPTGVKVDLGELNILPMVTPTGQITATHENGNPITDTNPVKLGEAAVFTVASDFADNGDVLSYVWYVKSPEQGEEAWTAIPGNNSPEYRRIAENDDPYEVKVTILARNGDDVCYRSLSLDVLFTTIITPLPVELIYFRAEKNDNTVVLKWATAMEKDNTGFEIQVSGDGKTFRKLDFVASKNSYSFTKQTYEYTDRENGKHGTRYYRLKQIDINGTFEYFGPRAVNFGTATDKTLAYPNPFQREINLDVEAATGGTMEIIVTNMMGKQIFTKTMEVAQGKSTITLPVEESLPGGVYIVTTRMGSVVNNFKLLKK